MRYALNLASDGRILSVTYEEYAAPGMPIVDNLPGGEGSDVTDYLFINGQFVYDPLPAPPAPEPTADEILDALLGVLT